MSGPPTLLNYKIAYGTKKHAESKLDALGFIGPAAEARTKIVLRGSEEDFAANLAESDYIEQHKSIGVTATMVNAALEAYQTKLYKGQPVDTHAQMLAENPNDRVVGTHRPDTIRQPAVVPVIASVFEPAPPKEAFTLVQQGKLSTFNIRGVDVKQRR